MFRFQSSVSFEGFLLVCKLSLHSLAVSISAEVFESQEVSLACCGPHFLSSRGCIQKVPVHPCSEALDSHSAACFSF